MYRIVIWPDSRIPDIRQIERGRIAGYRISGPLSLPDTGYPAGYPVFICRISGFKIPDIRL